MKENFNTLRQRATQIKNEVEDGANTSARVGSFCEDVVDTMTGTITEYNVSVQHPTSGIDGSNKYSLESAIAQVPQELRNVGLKVSFVNSAGQVETWEYQNGTFTNILSWTQSGAQKLSELEIRTKYRLGFYNRSNKGLYHAFKGDCFCSGYIPLIAGEKTISYYGEILGSDMSALNFYDKNQNYLSSLPEDRKQKVIELSEAVIPSDAAYLTFASNFNVPLNIYTNARQIADMNFNAVRHVQDNMSELQNDIQVHTGEITSLERIYSTANDELVNGFWNNQGSFNNYSGDYYGCKTHVPIKPGWSISVSPAVNMMDSSRSLVFYNKEKKMIRSHRLIIGSFPVKAPEESAYFTYTLRSRENRTVFVIPSVQELKDKTREEKKKNLYGNLNLQLSSVQYGELGSATNAYRNYAQLYSERPYKSLYIRIKSISFKIGELADTSDDEQGVYVLAGEKRAGNKIAIVSEANFYQQKILPNTVNTIETDFLLEPEQIPIVITVGGTLYWGGSPFKGNTGSNGGKLASSIGEDFSAEPSFSDDNVPSSNKGGFFTFAYDVYAIKTISGNSFLSGRKIGVIGDSESISPFPDVTWAKEEQDRAEYSIMGKSSGHWSEMICKRTGAILNNQGVSGSVVFGDISDQNSAMKQLERLDRDIDYLIVFTGTNGARLKDKNNVVISALGDETSPKLSAMPTTIDSNDETFTICGALKWMIEYMYELFPNAKIGFITPWAYQTRNDLDGTYILDESRVEGGDFAKAIRMICPLYSIPYFDNVKDSNICWFNDCQRHALMGYHEIVPTISQVKNFKIGKNMHFYVKDENALYKVLTEDSSHIPQSWQKEQDNSSGKAYGDGLHISNSNGHRYLSYKYESFLKSL